MIALHSIPVRSIERANAMNKHARIPNSSHDLQPPLHTHHTTFLPLPSASFSPGSPWLRSPAA